MKKLINIKTASDIFNNPATRKAGKLGFSQQEADLLWMFAGMACELDQVLKDQLLDLMLRQPIDCAKVIAEAKRASRIGKLRTFILNGHISRDIFEPDSMPVANLSDAEIADAYCKAYKLGFKGKTLMSLIKQIKVTRSQLRKISTRG